MPEPAPFPVAAADLCVKCGLCLPHCPTYGVMRDEADSPRGRIALMQGLVAGRLQATPRLAAHLEGCLGCRACETACPAAVPYGRLIDAGRAVLRARGAPEAFAVRLLRGLARRPRALRFVAVFAALAQRLGLLRLIRALLPRQAAWRLAARLPRIALARPRAVAPAAPRGTVQLFVGCLAPHVDAATLADAIAVYARLGWAVDVPAAQVCCGALHAHGGEPAHAAALAAANRRAFRNDAAVVASATGCTAQLAEHADAAFRAQVRDVVAHLATLDWSAAAVAASPPLRVALHLPCTQRFLPDGGTATAALLGRVPGLALVPLAERGCCGAGGAQALGFGAQAAALGARTAAAVLATQPDVVVSANWGCALNLRAALAALGRPDLEVVHPVTLVARRLGVAAYNPAP